jgi:hypothetical protein
MKKYEEIIDKKYHFRMPAFTYLFQNMDLIIVPQFLIEELDFFINVSTLA